MGGFFQTWLEGMNPRQQEIKQQQESIDIAKQQQALKEIDQHKALADSYGPDNADQIMKAYKSGQTPDASLFSQGQVSSPSPTVSVPATPDDLMKATGLLPSNYQPFTNQPFDANSEAPYGNIRKALSLDVQAPSGELPELQKAQGGAAAYALNPPLEKLSYGQKLMRGGETLGQASDKPFGTIESFIRNGGDISDLDQDSLSYLLRYRQGARGLTSTKIVTMPDGSQHQMRLNPETNQYDIDMGLAPETKSYIGTTDTGAPALLGNRSGNINPATNGPGLARSANPGGWPSPSMSQSGQPATVLPKPENLPAAQGDKLAGLTGLQNDLSKVKELYNPDYVGQVQGRVGGLEDWMGINADPKRALFRSLYSAMQSNVLHDKYGARLTATEISRLMRSLPDPSTSQVNFESGLKQFEFELNNMLGENTKALSGSGYRMPNMGKSRPPLSSFQR